VPAPHSDSREIKIFRITAPAKRGSLERVRGAALPASYTYRCDSRFDLSIRAAGTDSVDLYLPDDIRRLSRQPSGSGVKFTDGAVSVWSHGEDAILQDGARSYSCRQERQRSTPEDGSVAGVQFRAAGEQGDWMLEVHEDGITFTDDEDGRVIVPPATPEQAGGAIIYVSTSEAHRLQIVIEQRECMNLINGERFQTSVQVNLDGDGYSGCGYVR
jgi:uncharacterized membrane protein